MIPKRYSLIIYLLLYNIVLCNTEIDLIPHAIYHGESIMRGAVSVFPVDIDLDGDTDIIASSTGEDKIVWYENNGNHEFSIHIIADLESSTYNPVYATDMDGDNDIDVICAFSDNIAWFENDGQHNFRQHIISTGVSSTGSNIRAADIDADNDIDVISTFEDGKMAWYKNDGNENFEMHALTSFNGYHEVHIIDFDCDEDMD
jgi:hypothetical protein